LALLVVAAACAPLSAPPECAEGLGGTANETLFAQYFTSMELVSATSGRQPGDPAENGAAFPVAELLAINASVLSEVSVRFCVQGFFTGGVIADDLTTDLVPGDNQVHLDAFDTAADYVVRVIVDGVLVKNLPFTLH
jgi:hypothetical protein